MSGIDTRIWYLFMIIWKNHRSLFQLMMSFSFQPSGQHVKARVTSYYLWRWVISTATWVTFYFPSMNFFKNSDFVLDEFLWILKNSQHVHEQFFRILVKFFRILYSFLRISDVVLMNSCMNSWRGGSRTKYEFSEFLRTLKNKLTGGCCENDHSAIMSI
mgnify:CR=1 FL=1